MDYPIQLVEQAGRHLRALRKRQGLSQQALGLRLGVSQGRVAQIENGTGSISFEQVLRCVQAVGGELLIRDVQPPVAVNKTRASPSARHKAPPTPRRDAPVTPPPLQDTSPHVAEATPAFGGILHAPRNQGSW